MSTVTIKANQGLTATEIWLKNRKLAAEIAIGNFNYTWMNWL
jgi:hypothetical protein